MKWPILFLILCAFRVISYGQSTNKITLDSFINYSIEKKLIPLQNDKTVFHNWIDSIRLHYDKNDLFDYRDEDSYLADYSSGKKSLIYNYMCWHENLEHYPVPAHFSKWTKYQIQLFNKRVSIGIFQGNKIYSIDKFIAIDDLQMDDIDWYLNHPNLILQYTAGLHLLAKLNSKEEEDSIELSEKFYNFVKSNFKKDETIFVSNGCVASRGKVLDLLMDRLDKPIPKLDNMLIFQQNACRSRERLLISSRPLLDSLDVYVDLFVTGDIPQLLVPIDKLDKLDCNDQILDVVFSIINEEDSDKKQELTKVIKYQIREKSRSYISLIYALHHRAIEQKLVIYDRQQKLIFKEIYIDIAKEKTEYAQNILDEAYHHALIDYEYYVSLCNRYPSRYNASLVLDKWSETGSLPSYELDICGGSEERCSQLAKQTFLQYLSGQKKLIIHWDVKTVINMIELADSTFIVEHIDTILDQIVNNGLRSDVIISMEDYPQIYSHLHAVINQIKDVWIINSIHSYFDRHGLCDQVSLVHTRINSLLPEEITQNSKAISAKAYRQHIGRLLCCSRCVREK